MIEPAGLIRVIYIDFSQLFIIIGMSVTMHRSRAKSPRLVMCLTTTLLSSTLRDVRVGDDRTGGHRGVDQLARINEVYKVLDKRERKKVFGRRDNRELYILSVA